MSDKQEMEWKGNTTDFRYYISALGSFNKPMVDRWTGYLRLDYKKPLVRLIDFLIKMLYKIRGRI